MPTNGCHIESAHNTKTRMTMVIGKDWNVLSDPRAEDRVILNEIRPLGEKE